MSAVRVLLTGGHAGTTALSVIQEIQSRDDAKNWELFWIGATQAVEGKKDPTLESQTLPSMGVHCYTLSAGRLQRKFTRYTIPSLLKIPGGFFQAFFLLLKIKPAVVLSFGGYIAFPVVVSAWILRIPVIIHEQVATAGRSNIFSAPFATKIAISRKTSERYFPKNKTVLTGNPVTKNYMSIQFKSRLSNPPVLFITGGSRGSTPLNDLITSNIEKLVNDFDVVHQTGSFDYKEVMTIREKLTASDQKKYSVYSTVTPLEFHELFEKADIIIARSGANTVSQVLLAKRPAVFIPLPFAYNDEQKANALYAKEFGIAEIIDQKDATSEELLRVLQDIKKNWTDIVQKVKDKESPDIHSASHLVDLLSSYI